MPAERSVAVSVSDSWRTRARALVCFATALRVVESHATHLWDTEAYYVGWARWPSLSYYDHPPLVAWTTWLVTRFDTSALAVRLVPIACAAAFGALFYHFAARLFSSRAAFFALFVVTVLPAFVGTGVLVNPEGLLAPLWILALGALYDLRERDEPWRPLLLGALVGVAFLAKYTAVLLVPLALGWLATSRETRRWLRRPSLYAAGLLALAIASPVVVWNAERGFPSLELHLVERAARPSLTTYATNGLHALTQQFLFFHPVVFFAFPVVAVVAVARARRDARYRFLACVSLPTLAFLWAMMVRVKDSEPHWTMVGYMPLAIAMGALADEYFDRRAMRGYVAAVCATSAVALALVLAHVASPTLVALVPDSMYDANANPLHEMLGWGRIDEAVLRQVRSLGPRAVVASDHNVICGQLEVSLDDTPPVYCLSARRTEFDFVGRGNVPHDAPVVYVDTARYPRSPGIALRGRSCELAERVNVTRGGHALQRVRIWSCSSESETDGARRVVVR